MLSRIVSPVLVFSVSCLRCHYGRRAQLDLSRQGGRPAQLVQPLQFRIVDRRRQFFVCECSLLITLGALGPDADLCCHWPRQCSRLEDAGLASRLLYPSSAAYQDRASLSSFSPLRKGRTALPADDVSQGPSPTGRSALS